MTEYEQVDREMVQTCFKDVVKHILCRSPLYFTNFTVDIATCFVELMSPLQHLSDDQILDKIKAILVFLLKNNCLVRSEEIIDMIIATVPDAIPSFSTTPRNHEESVSPVIVVEKNSDTSSCPYSDVSFEDDTSESANGNLSKEEDDPIPPQETNDSQSTTEEEEEEEEFDTIKDFIFTRDIKNAPNTGTTTTTNNTPVTETLFEDNEVLSDGDIDYHFEGRVKNNFLNRSRHKALSSDGDLYKLLNSP